MPFAALVSQVRPGTPRLLVNRERVGEGAGMLRGPAGPAGPFDFDGTGGVTRDGFVQGDCDAAVLELVQLLGWEEELEALADPGQLNWPHGGNSALRDAINGAELSNAREEVSLVDVAPPPPRGFTWSGEY